MSFKRFSIVLLALASALMAKPIGISAGAGYSVILDDTNNTYVSGSNEYGQLGLSASQEMVAKPLLVTHHKELKDKTKKVFSNFQSTFYITNDDKVFAVGLNKYYDNSNGKLGIGSNVEKTHVLTDITSQFGSETIVKIAISSYTTSFIAKSGKVFIAGLKDLYAAPGHYILSPRLVNVPTDISSEFGAGVKIVDAIPGGSSTLYLSDTGKIFLKGPSDGGYSGSFKILSDGSKLSDYVKDYDSKFNNIAMKDLALSVNDGSIYALGKNNKVYYRKAYNADWTINKLNAIDVSNLFGSEVVKDIEASVDKVYFLTNSDKVFVIDTKSGNQTPQDITHNFGNDKIISISGSKLQSSGVDIHTLFLASSGKVYSVGNNSYGQLLNSKPTVYLSPEQMYTQVSAMTYGDTHSLFIKNDEVYAVGENKYGQLGNGTKTTEKVPVNITSNFGSETVQNISTTSNRTLFLTVSNKVYVTGSALGRSQTTVPVDITSTFGNNVTPINIATTRTDDFVLMSNGQVYVTKHGLLGKSHFNNERITKMYVSETHSFFVTDQNKTYAMGSNYGGFLGDGTLTPRNLPVDISNQFSEPITQIAPMDHWSTIFLGKSGKLYVTGRNPEKGFFASKVYKTPTLLRSDFNGSKIVGVYPSYISVFYVLANKDVLASGFTQNGNKGIGKLIANMSTPPTKVDFTKQLDIVDIKSHIAGTLFLTKNKELYGAGKNTYGQLGGQAYEDTTLFRSVVLP